MVGLSVRLWIWVLLVSVPVQAFAAVSLRARGPAHTHTEASLTAHRAFQAAFQSSTHDAHAASHTHEHAGSRAAHHDHDPADPSVIFIPDGNEDDPVGAAASKASVPDLPGVLPCPWCGAAKAVGSALIQLAPMAFGSIVAAPLYRPPR